MTASKIGIGLLVLIGASSVNAAIFSPDQRSQKIGLATSIASVSVNVVDPVLIEEIGNPFSLDRFPEVVEQEFVSVRLPDDEVLNVLSPYVVPTGVFLVNGEHIAMFQGKQIRGGESLSVLYEGEEYNITISEIDRSSFTMEYKEKNLKVKLK